jgi:hypothetical protein
MLHLNSNLYLPFGIYHNSCMIDCKGKLIPLNQVLDVNTPSRRFFDWSQMETPNGAQNVTLTSSTTPKTFRIHPQLFNAPSSNAFIVAILKKM